MKVTILGATGFIGRRLVAELLAGNYEVTVVTRDAAKARRIFGDTVEVASGNPLQAGAWQAAVTAAEAVIILLGAPIVAKRWSAKRKQVLLDSRIKPTRLVVEAIKAAPTKPRLLISGSAIGYYGDRGDAAVDEAAPPGEDFAARLCSRWEEAADQAKESGVRVVKLRTGFVLGAGGGSLRKMIGPFKYFLGGPLGNGRQYISWIHIDDYARIVKLLIEDESVSGPINMTAPKPVTNKEFSHALGRVLGRPSWLPVPAVALKLLMGEAAGLVVKGQRVMPRVVERAGYKYQFTEIEAALAAATAERKNKI